MTSNTIRWEQREDAADALNEAIAGIEDHRRYPDSWRDILIIGALSAFRAGFYVEAEALADLACTNNGERWLVSSVVLNSDALELPPDILRCALDNALESRLLEQSTFLNDLNIS